RALARLRSAGRHRALVGVGRRTPGDRVLIWVWGLRVVGEFVAFGRVDEAAAEFAVGLADRPREIDVTDGVGVRDLDVDRVARVPVETLQSAVELAAMEQSGDAVADVDEHAEVGEAVDRTAVETTGRELVRVRSLEFENDVLLVTLADVAIRGGAADD